MSDKQAIRAYFDKVDDAEAASIRLRALGADFMEIGRLHRGDDEGAGLPLPINGNYIGPSQGGLLTSAATPVPQTAYAYNEEDNEDEYRGETEHVREHRSQDIMLYCELPAKDVPEAIALIERAGGNVRKQQEERGWT